jgi:nucleotide-binding universal stress UspA family protein
MKKLLILTDFSAIANHAAGYGYDLAKQMKAAIILCNAALVAADIPRAGLAAWPLEERDTYLQNSQEEIKLLQGQLEQHNSNDDYRPAMTFLSDPGTLANVFNDTLDETPVDLVVMGAHSGDGIQSFLLDKHCMNMIKIMRKPLLMIPPDIDFSVIKKITFLTDDQHSAADLEFLPVLNALARQLGAVVAVSRLGQGKETRVSLTTFFKSGETNLLAVVHRPHNFFDRLLKQSGTITTKNQLAVPLLIFKD